MMALLKAFFAALMDAILDRQREQDHQQAIRNETTAMNDLEDIRDDQKNADRIARAVDAVRHDGAGGMRHPGPGAEPDTRGYRD
jgi:hypothetical protein